MEILVLTVRVLILLLLLFVIIIAIAILITIVLMFLIYRKERINVYFEILHNRIFKNTHIISMRTRKTIYRNNYSKNKALFNRCIKDVEDVLQLGQVYKFNTHKLILKKLKKSGCIKIISCKASKLKSLKGLNHVLHGDIVKGFFLTVIYGMPIIKLFNCHKVQFYDVKISRTK